MLIQCNFFSKSLKQNTNVNVIIPSPDSDEILNNTESSYFKKGAKYQVLYLLHGAYGDYSDWQRFTSIEKYAQKYKIAVVMPSVTNSFYMNMAHGPAFFDYMTKELPQVITSYFAISEKPEDTFIAGLSMGGYGSFYIALSKPEAFHCAASLSGTVDICRLVKDVKEGQVPSPFVLEDICEQPDKLQGTEMDLFALVKKQSEAGKKLPDLFMTCGTEDFIYDMNKEAIKKFRNLDINITYEEHPGIHDWDFWDTNIKRVLEWMPLKGDVVLDIKL